jgi:hypothetical protein
VAPPSQRVLISLGLCWMSPAGYLPVLAGSALSVNDQVRALLGEGLDLRFCITTADAVAHEVEAAQHMQRISLLQGLDDPLNKPHVDILVPDGTALATGTATGTGLYDAALGASTQQTGGVAYKGAAREETLPTGGTAHYSACAGLSQVVIPKLQTMARAAVRPGATGPTLTPNLHANVFVRKTAAAGAKLDAKVEIASLQARDFIAAGEVAAGGGPAETGAARASSANETVDGLWIKARVDERIASLGVGDHTAIDLRVVVGTRPAKPMAIELGFQGTLTVDSASQATGALVQTGVLNGVASIGLVQENQTEQSTLEYLITERFNWKTTVRHAGAPGNATITLDFDTGAKSGILFRLAKVTAGNAAQISYQLALVTPATSQAQENVLPLGQYVLGADPTLADPANLNHQYAEGGLAIVQAALIVSDPALKTQAESLLFPAVPSAAPELVIRAVRDWVAFVRRRERQCAPSAPPPPQAPVRRYRVIEFTAKSLDDARQRIAGFQTALKDPAALANILEELIATQANEKVHLVVSFAGGSATAQSDLGSVASDWKTFAPGKDILYAAAGAVGESDPALQLGRLATLRAAIAGVSQEVPRAPENAIVPYPIEAVPPDADGVMLLITVQPVPAVAKHELVEVAQVSTVLTHVVPYFGAEAMHTTVDFLDAVPQGSALSAFIQQMPAGAHFDAVVLWTLAATVDSGAAARAVAVRDVLAAAGLCAADAPTDARVLTAQLRAQLQVSQSLTGIDDAIALELHQ